ncbi:bifunctional GNAT family N-acetyltransferase/acetate--CoA ligase family protein [Nonomuraea soli]|uniref:Acyl-CoA synthetase (NDP forming)/RimJ/RimL family protein N-acetyltransferase n=1 Tax=Nonomuraea soli TaxID=1032476 RepID=A0A7W0CFB4_9ACTN|nr:bifunctional GNAT family N-acetyltransferase/acetate--CoA ligase family protein [Nonomuraea soli]MBA2889964.1 acyl-CoA synthetase (NDP forming)/RimJ/RimL family protein N-acetyltransferase [Nonomuraea soli]
MYDVLLRDGGIAQVRPLRPEDRPSLHDLVERTSERSAFLRFFTGGRSTAHLYMDRITGDGYQGHATVALMKGRLVAVAEYIPSGHERADLAILIDDSAQGHGLGTLLLEHVALDAAEHGVRLLVAEVLPENRPMIRVLRDLGAEVVQRFDQGLVNVRIEAKPTTGLRDRIEQRDHEAERASLARVLHPSSVAVIGAGRDPSSVGHRVVRNLRDGGFAGPIHPINPRSDTCYPDLRSVPGPVDLAVIAVPARHVLDVARDCAEAQVAGLVVLSAGFAEAGNGGEAELLKICRTAGMRLIGPNCLGILNTAIGLNATFLPLEPAPGRVALMSQSGAVGAAILDRLPVSTFVSVGNKADVSGNDLLEYWEDDPDTDVIALYLESFGNPRKFLRIAGRVSAKKPILLVKSGRSDSGDRAVRSHTAAAATPDLAVDALVRASGVIRLDSVAELLDTARLLSSQPLPRGRRVAIIGNSGGPEAMAADACERHGLIVPELTSRKFKAAAGAALGNPVDLTAEAPAEQIGEAIETFAPEVDAVLVVYTPPFGSGLERTRQVIASCQVDVPVVACVIGHDGLIDGRVPSYAFPEQAVAALARAADYAESRGRVTAASLPEPNHAARDLVREALKTHPDGCWADPALTARLLSCYGVMVAETIGVDGPETAAEAAGLIGLPAVLKATGPVHKSDVGGVRLGLGTQEEVRQAYREMAASVPGMTGAIVQHQVPPGVEVIVGGVSYPAFGPLVMVGMGGVTADLLGDRVFRVPPLTRAEAIEMIGELRCAPLLYGYRGSAPADVEALADQVMRVSRLLDDLPEVAELDLNPIIVSPHGAAAVDVRIRLAPCEARPSPLLRHLR